MSIGPGHTPTAVMPSPASSMARYFTIVSIAALAAPSRPWPGSARKLSQPRHRHDPAARRHVRRGEPDQIEEALDRHAHGLLDMAAVDLRERLEGTGSGVRHDHVEAAEALDDCCTSDSTDSVSAMSAWTAKRGAADRLDLGDCLLRRLVVPAVVDHHVGLFGTELEGETLAHAAGPARDDDGLVLHVHGALGLAVTSAVIALIGRYRGPGQEPMVSPPPTHSVWPVT